jgi:hypothetical protein
VPRPLLHHLQVTSTGEPESEGVLPVRSIPYRLESDPQYIGCTHEIRRACSGKTIGSHDSGPRGPRTGHAPIGNAALDSVQMLSAVYGPAK